MNAFDRRGLFTSGAAAALLAATGLSAAGSGPKKGGRLRAALSGASRADTWDMQSNAGLFMQAAAQGAVFDTLTEISAEGTLRGELATHWEGSADARVWVFDLRRNVEFHNGVEFGARDVVASLGNHQAGGILPTISRITAITSHQVKIELADGNADLPYLMSDPQLIILPASHTEAALRDGIGTGLYRVKRFLPGRQFLGVRVSEHYKDGYAGWFDTVEFTSVPDARVRVQALEGGFVDVADLTDPYASSGTSFSVRVRQAARGTPVVAANANIGMADVIGQKWPMDNLRMAERWWMI